MAKLWNGNEWRAFLPGEVLPRGDKGGMAMRTYSGTGQLDPSMTYLVDDESCIPLVDAAFERYRQANKGRS